uniref:Phospholipase B-like n=1 Tax=Dermatophagoides pteronyssinus TaxID=6956 RepID=A0A6P6YIJ9_DERPT|nr:putative phospholipase B-like 2 [Dermatophagoides pteronyssinus]
MLLFLFIITVFLLPIRSEQQQQQQNIFENIYYCISEQSNYQIFPCNQNNNERPDFSQQEKNQSNIIAYARFINHINRTGWSELDIGTNPNQNDYLQAYFAGYLEGKLTKKLIQSYQYNILDGNECQLYKDFIEKSLNNTIERSLKKSNQNDPYWIQIQLQLLQLAGLDDGYLNTNINRKIILNHPDFILKNIDPCGTILLHLYTEYDDLEYLLNHRQPSKQPSEHCSALIKILPNRKDIYVSHVTFANLKSMLRIMKRYNLNYRTSNSKTLVMSSYPGTLFSIDDYYILSEHMIVQETTIHNYNLELYKKISINEMIFEFLRTMVANRLARNGQEWSKIFSYYNSGTYNNQFMIIDYKKFQPDQQKIQPNFLWILEQMPGIIIANDMTEILLKQTYWPSYNVPYFKDIYNISNTNEMFRKFGEHYSYDKCGRAQIFKRDHNNVLNLKTMYHLMRYNNFYNDPLSRCNCTPPYTGYRAISSRCDLNDPNGHYPLDAYSFRSSAGLDVKLTNYNHSKLLQMIAVSGPTYDQVPVFSWQTTKLKNIKHLDQPIEWKFKPILTDWNHTNINGFNEFQFDL